MNLGQKNNIFEQKNSVLNLFAANLLCPFSTVVLYLSATQDIAHAPTILVLCVLTNFEPRGLEVGFLLDGLTDSDSLTWD